MAGLAVLVFAPPVGKVPLLHAAEADGAIEEIEVSAPRPLRSSLARVIFGGQRLGGDRVAAAARLDRALAVRPDFSLFRRADSLVAHPTTQGPSLRLKGPNASARALVLLDGLPIDNPFGGWVDWSAVPPLLVARVEMVTGSGAGPFGDRAETGVVMITTRAAQDTSGNRPVFDLRLRADGHGGRGASAIVRLVDGAGNRLRFDGFGDSSPGYHAVPRAARGPVDRRLEARVAGGGFSWRRALDRSWTVGVDLRGFLERRRSGLEAAVNRSRGLDGAVRVFRVPADGHGRLDLSIWHRRRVFRNVFAIVLDEARTLVRPVLDQFRVPGRASGARLDWWRSLAAGRTALRLGLDYERREGATHERFRNMGEGFTRLREAGGRQGRLGLYGGFEMAFGRTVAMLADLRLDWWRNGPGRTRERSIADGRVLGDARLATRDGLVVNGRVGFGWRAARRWRLRADVHSAFRVPTLNELYRPFRIGRDVTMANATLVPERLTGASLGLDVLLTPALAEIGHDGMFGEGGSRATLALFVDRLRDGIGNITMAEGPGLFPGAGFVPAGGVLRERQNIPLIRNLGIELGFDLALDANSLLGLRWLHRTERIRRPPAGGEELRGRRVALSPRERLLVEIRRQFGQRLSLGARLEYLGAVFEDDRNRRRLPSASPLGAWISFDLLSDWKLRLSFDNLLDVRVVDRIDPDGFIRRARPRFVGLSLIRLGA